MEKYERLKLYIQSLGSVAVAFSGGVDSAFLLKAAKEALGSKAVAVTVKSELFPKRELNEAERFCKEENIQHIVLDADALSIDGFCENPANRCYLCKKSIFSRISEIAAKNGINEIAEGSNVDDVGDYRPGLIALEELGIRSPLRENGFTKREIREMSKRLGLPTWEKQSMACLASRFVYGETITKEKLKRVDNAEQFLRELGFKQFRVRIHENVARIEVLPEDFSRILEAREKIYMKFKKYGFLYTALDLLGYRMGSMNEMLDNTEIDI